VRQIGPRIEAQAVPQVFERAVDVLDVDLRSSGFRYDLGGERLSPDSPCSRTLMSANQQGAEVLLAAGAYRMQNARAQRQEHKGISRCRRTRREHVPVSLFVCGALSRNLRQWHPERYGRFFNLLATRPGPEACEVFSAMIGRGRWSKALSTGLARTSRGPCVRAHGLVDFELSGVTNAFTG